MMPGPNYDIYVLAQMVEMSVKENLSLLKLYPAVWFSGMILALNRVQSKTSFAASSFGPESSEAETTTFLEILTSGWRRMVEL
eukprot:89196-Amphidinium_carterae.1